MDYRVKDYKINEPVFVLVKKKLFQKPYVKLVAVNERIVEVPFVHRALAGLALGSKILDLGCSESILPMQLATLGFDVVGVDFRRYPFQAENLIYQSVDVTSMPFEDESFDAVTSISMFEHVGLGFYDDPKYSERQDIKGFEEAYRVLKVDGHFIVSVPCGISFEDDFQRIYDVEVLDKIMSPFLVLERRYFRKVLKPEANNNCWVEVSSEEAKTVEPSGCTDCIAIYHAQKKARIDYAI